MSVETTRSEEDVPKILAHDDLGDYQGSQTFAHGAGQTTILLKTSQGQCVLRYYENRSQRHVLFEVGLLRYLRGQRYPVPAILADRTGQSCGQYRDKPYILIEFVEGEHGTDPNESFDRRQAAEAVRVIAQLHSLTVDFQPSSLDDREVFDVAYCWKEFGKKHSSLVDEEAGRWLKRELDHLEFPDSLPQGICHADLNYSNFLFHQGAVVAVLDFDMSMSTHLIYDIASLIYWWAWPPTQGFQEQSARELVSEYSKWRTLSEAEKSHIYDALKLIILLGISWSEESDFEKEKAKIEFLNSIGREKFAQGVQQ